MITRPPLTIHVIVQDFLTSFINGFPSMVDEVVLEDDYFYTGPTTRRIAIVDFDSSNKSGWSRAVPLVYDPNSGTRIFDISRKRRSGLSNKSRINVSPKNFLTISSLFPSDDSKKEADINSIINTQKPNLSDLVKNLNNFLENLYRNPQMIKVLTFGTVQFTIFTIDKYLNRSISWSFGESQLLVMPRVKINGGIEQVNQGAGGKAYYDRENHCLQFNRYDEGSHKLYACLSRDIVAHETGHAIFDGIAPDLCNACSPQSLALHEAVADIIAVVVALSSESLQLLLASKSKTEILKFLDPKNHNFLSAVGELASQQFSFDDIFREIKRTEEAKDGNYQLLAKVIDFFKKQQDLRGVRDLGEAKTLYAEHDFQRGQPDLSSHNLSQVVSSAVYRSITSYMIRQLKNLPDEFFTQNSKEVKDILKKYITDFSQLLIGALDYLVMGEATFEDYANAIDAYCRVKITKQPTEKFWSEIQSEFSNEFSNTLPERSNLAPNISFVNNYLRKPDLNLNTVVDSDWAAYEFANNLRELLNTNKRFHEADIVEQFHAAVPTMRGEASPLAKLSWQQGLPHLNPKLPVNLRVRPRILTTDKGKKDLLFFKFSWDSLDPNSDELAKALEGNKFRCITQGATLVIDYNERTVLSLLITNAGNKTENIARNQYLLSLYKSGQLRVGEAALDLDGNWLPSILRAEKLIDDVVRIRGGSQTFHWNFEAETDKLNGETNE